MLSTSRAPTAPVQVFSDFRQQGSHYELFEQMGGEGPVRVYRARHVRPTGLDRRVLIRRVLPPVGTDPGFLELFSEEARWTTRVRHPNLVQVESVGRAAGSELYAAAFRSRLLDILPLVAAERMDILEVMAAHVGAESSQDVISLDIEFTGDLEGGCPNRPSTELQQRPPSPSLRSRSLKVARGDFPPSPRSPRGTNRWALARSSYCRPSRVRSKTRPSP
ncbi:MAG: hypothetical protein HY791_05130 [Deltaproteobacteria bacterium]|nr:hypothetical protein [Deltaproteobacteria bacterium]